MDKLTYVKTRVAPITPQLVLDVMPNITLFSHDTREEMLQSMFVEVTSQVNLIN